MGYVEHGYREDFSRRPPRPELSPPTEREGFCAMATCNPGRPDAAETRAGEMFGCAALDVRSLERSINFYSLALGFEVIGVVSRAADRRVLMSLSGRFNLSIREDRHIGLQHAPSGDAWELVVDDLDQVRRNLWDLGFVVSRDSGAPDQIYRSFDGRSLYVRDPDAHEIRLLERRAGSHVVACWDSPDYSRRPVSDCA
jgi:catechol 2,3-dioxygenase-like lactoylglutathione lyase family enzyme